MKHTNREYKINPRTKGPFQKMKTWTRSETIALASMKCQCQGLGLCSTASGETVPCNCVLRAIFRACHKRFKNITTSEVYLSTVKLERTGSGRSSHMYFSRKSEEYVADFTLTCKRVLNPADYRLFKALYLLGADVSLCARQLQMSSHSIEHRKAVIEITLGRVFAEIKPFPLFPLDEYFSDTVRGQKVDPCVIPTRKAA